MILTPLAWSRRKTVRSGARDLQSVAAGYMKFGLFRHYLPIGPSVFVKSQQQKASGSRLRQLEQPIAELRIAVFQIRHATGVAVDPETEMM